ncbi:hypothetical protein BX600DRAFT_506126 [Xylariales sp. PMI_506]|nr:hypothetical protein BX600DRAFT_506126 [Xylariales sp. PMI_506]
MATHENTANGESEAQSKVGAAPGAAWNLPAFPSQILDTYSTRSPPAFYTIEDIPAITAFHNGVGMENSGDLGFPSAGVSAPSHSFATTANKFIDQSLGRVPSGGSVIEPDSVLGESGRLYHGYKEGKYFLPNDVAEQDRLDLQHEILRLLFDGWMALAPITTVPRNVIDIGCGTGIWASEFGHRNGLDAIQPIPTTTNCAFLKADAEDEWIFPDPQPDHANCSKDVTCQHMIKIDYVHLRMMFTCFSDPKKVMQHAFNDMNPGGWIGFQDSSMEFHQANPNFPGDACIRWGQACIKGARAAGRDINLIKNYKGWLEEIGCAPWHPSPRLRRTGEYSLQNAMQIAGTVKNLFKASGMADEEADTLVEEMKQETLNTKNFGYGIIHVIYGRKPMPAGSA